MAVDLTAVSRSAEPGDPAATAEDWEQSLYWRQQYQLARLSRDGTVPHAYARNAAVASKGVQGTIPTVSDMALQLVKEELLNAQPQGTTPGKRTGNSMLEKRERREEERRRHINEDIHHQFWTSLDFSGQGLITVSPRIVHYNFLQKLYLNNNNLQKMPTCISKLSEVRILDLSGNQLYELPPEIGHMSNLRVLLLFDNHIRSLPYELGSLFQLQMLGILGNPWAVEDKPGRDAFSKYGTKGLIHYLRDFAPVGSPPQPRQWMHLNDVGDAKNELTMMSYNTLCDQYATPAMYGYTPSWALSWDYRSQLLVEEVLSHEMDVICLQEVNTAALEDLWVPVLSPRGYKVIFYPKTRARTMSKPSEARLVDGCATFYKASKLHLVEKYPVEYNSKALLKDDLKKSVDIFNRVMSRDNVAIIGVFEFLDTGRPLVIANTHLHWDPAFRDVKLVQTALLLEETEKMAKKYAKQSYGNDLKKVPVLIAGDFNSSTDSGVVHLFNHSGVPPDHEDFEGHSYGNYTEHGIHHTMRLKTAYPEDLQLPFTNYTPDFVETIDYIVYSTPTIKVNALLDKIDQDYAARYVGFPNAHYPSDHIPIAAHFELT